MSRGFFIRISKSFYAGPKETLGEARSEAKNFKESHGIYHGELERISEDIYDDSKLSFVEKT